MSLALRGIEARLGDFVLRADLQVPPGARVAVMGPSGSGKTTLLSLVAGFVKPVRGQVLWDGRDLGPLPPGARPVSILFQDQNLFPHLSAAQNVGLGLRPDLRLSRADAAAVEAALESVGLGGMGGRKPAALSGGQQGRVALARVLLRQRPILLLDEAFAALGPALKDQMLGLLRQIAADSGATVLMVTHDPEDARRFADLGIVVAGGVASHPAPIADLFANPPPALADWLGEGPGGAPQGRPAAASPLSGRPEHG
ncbi:ATP-binding cassette domain-containing protein [Paracoccus suum]|uniref:ATP-binding cassette domain-containing protein n=1 Tax=Paracoccus suum TaxID=2259340 RepID=A0A344PIQ8_9RHOB|nr:ATP-binding cassette domain-containing protein [Paracoccus suum]